ncbi:CBS domain-containing protein [Halomicroarcula sp. GCM10025324]|jgi:CBS domain-containing protein|uniref:CBS domain-containing protein n=1 Tax=Haloarcula TaxID=2237 RepID=UPI0023E8AA27|nr:CBS domain-containing protein [Halomicroarcula sp. ZS-22-S1]
MNDSVTVREVMDREFLGASESDDLHETTELLLESDDEAVLVLRGNDPVGCVTRDDILTHLLGNGETSAATIGDVMRDSLPAIEPDARLPEARDTMTSRSTSWLLVVEDGEPLGTLTASDILSTSLLEGEVTDSVEEPVQLGTTGQAATTDGTTSIAEDNFDDQGICSACGTLTQNLSSFNGQLLCADCRDV